MFDDNRCRRGLPGREQAGPLDGRAPVAHEVQPGGAHPARRRIVDHPQLVGQLTEEHRDLPGVRTKGLPVDEGSPFDGRTLGDTAMRTRTGVSVVAVMRAGQVHPSPGPDFTLTAGDLLVAVGTSEGLAAAGKSLKH